MSRMENIGELNYGGSHSNGDQGACLTAIILYHTLILNVFAEDSARSACLLMCTYFLSGLLADHPLTWKPSPLLNPQCMVSGFNSTMLRKRHSVRAQRHSLLYCHLLLSTFQTPTALPPALGYWDICCSCSVTKSVGVFATP